MTDPFKRQSCLNTRTSHSFVTARVPRVMLDATRMELVDGVCVWYSYKFLLKQGLHFKGFCLIFAVFSLQALLKKVLENELVVFFENRLDQSRKCILILLLLCADVAFNTVV